MTANAHGVGGRAGKSAFGGVAGGLGAQNPCKTGLSWCPCPCQVPSWFAPVLPHLKS